MERFLSGVLFWGFWVVRWSHGAGHYYSKAFMPTGDCLEQPLWTGRSV